ncbi:MAG: SPOR domain-containing protein [Rhodospirillales bacterium]|nr:SPOR domain-containing protein [Rhodospirillales bacterium]
MLLLFVLAVALVGGGAWAWLIHGKRVTAMFAAGGGDGVPVVRADSLPFKVRPRDPGGMEIPDRDKLVYGRLQGEGSESRVERLLGPPETPIRPPRAASAPAPQVKERLARVPSEAQVLAAKPPPPALGLSKPAANPEPEPEDSPPTDVETAPASPLANVPTPLDARGESVVRPPTGGTARPSAPMRETAPATQAAAPAREPQAPPTPVPAPAPQVAAPAEPGSGYLIQVGAVRAPEGAETEWNRLLRQHGETLRGLKLFVARADLGDKGVFWRLRAGPFADEAAAKNRCAELAKRKAGCLVVKSQG